MAIKPLGNAVYLILLHTDIILCALQLSHITENQAAV